MRVIEILTGWSLTCDGHREYNRHQTQTLKKFPASVPGHVHLDLYAAHVIGHPFAERFEAGLGWIDETDWTYECEFNWIPSGARKQILRFEGVDTVATIHLNGKQVAEHDNFFCAFEIDVSDALEAGSNHLEVRLRSAVRTGDERRRRFFEKNGIPIDADFFDERAFVRKPGYMSGWDWGPRLVSAGIWKPVKLLDYDSRMTHFEVLQKPFTDGRFELEALYEIDGPASGKVFYNGKEVAGKKWIVDDELWWPNGEGKQNLQSVSLVLDDGQVAERKIGLRTICLRREPDAIGTSFEFEVNGRPIWIRGANWIPHDSFPSQVSEEGYDQAVSRYASLGMNMLRVWGGGCYETEAVYDACDREGVLVWQDFPYACSYYPDDAEHLKIAAEEARQNIKRLRSGTSLALWCGNNEMRAMHYQRWSENQPKTFYGAAIFDEVLKRAVEEHDGARPYIESSPLLVNAMPGVLEAEFHSDDHFWQVWHGKGDWKHYGESKTRFSSEFGFASSCSLDAWRLTSERRLTVDDPAVLWHDKTNKGWEVFKSYVAEHYGESTSLEEWIYKSQMNQRDAMRAAIEHYRTSEGCRGALIWQANDCWPVQSWSLEDYSRVLKLAAFELKRLYHPTLIAVRTSPAGYDVFVCDDSSQPLEDEVVWTEFDLNGRQVSRRCANAAIHPNCRAMVFTIPIGEASPASVFCCKLANDDASERWIIPFEPKNMSLENKPIRVAKNGDELAVDAGVLVLDLVVWAESGVGSLLELDSILVGNKARTGCNLKFELGARGDIGSLCARSLAGRHPVFRA